MFATAAALLGVTIVAAVYLDVKKQHGRGETPTAGPRTADREFPLSSSEHVPVRPQSIVDRWKRHTWAARWTYLGPTTEELKDYVDDIVRFRDIDPETGMLRGDGESPYENAPSYELVARLSSKNFAFMVYEFRDRPNLVGAVIAQMDAYEDEISGWWLGFVKEANKRSLGGGS